MNKFVVRELIGRTRQLKTEENVFLSSGYENVIKSDDAQLRHIVHAISKDALRSYEDEELVDDIKLDIYKLVQKYIPSRCDENELATIIMNEMMEVIQFSALTEDVIFEYAKTEPYKALTALTSPVFFRQLTANNVDAIFETLASNLDDLTEDELFEFIEDESFMELIDGTILKDALIETFNEQSRLKCFTCEVSPKEIEDLLRTIEEKIVLAEERERQEAAFEKWRKEGESAFEKQTKEYDIDSESKAKLKELVEAWRNGFMTSFTLKSILKAMCEEDMLIYMRLRELVSVKEFSLILGSI